MQLITTSISLSNTPSTDLLLFFQVDFISQELVETFNLTLDIDGDSIFSNDTITPLEVKILDNDSEFKFVS